MFAANAAGMIALGLLNARLVRTIAVRRLLMVGLVGSSVAAVVLLLVAVLAAGAALGMRRRPVVLLFVVVVATRGLVSANATVLGVQRAPAAGAASAVLGACMFGGGILVSPLLALGEGSAVPMAAVVAGGAFAALLATVLLTRRPHRRARSACSAPASRSWTAALRRRARGSLRHDLRHHLLRISWLARTG